MFVYYNLEKTRNSFAVKSNYVFASFVNTRIYQSDKYTRGLERNFSIIATLANQSGSQLCHREPMKFLNLPHLPNGQRWVIGLFGYMRTYSEGVKASHEFLLKLCFFLDFVNFHAHILYLNELLRLN